MGYRNSSSAANRVTAGVQKDSLRLGHVIDELGALLDRTLSEGRVKDGSRRETIVGCASRASSSDDDICPRRSEQSAGPQRPATIPKDVDALPLSQRGLENKFATNRR